MAHPTYQPNIQNHKIEQIDATLHQCRFYNNKPIGPALISYKGKNKETSFKGLGIFNNQCKLENSPFIYVTGNGDVKLISKM